MAYSLPHTDDEVEALVQKLIDEGMVRQKAILDLVLQFDNACTTKDDLRKTYKKCNDIPQESSGSSSQTHEFCDVYLTEKELHQLHLDEEALKEALEEQARDVKEREEKIRQKQAEDEEFMLEFERKFDSDYEIIPGPAGIVQLSSSTRVEPSSSTTNPVRIIPGSVGIVQQAKMLKEKVFILVSDEALMSTQEYMQKIVEDVGEDDDFKSGVWVSATNYVTATGGTVTGCLRDIKNFLKKEKLDEVVAIVKSCSPNDICDLNVTMKDLSGTIPRTIHHKVIGDGGYEKDITVGAALILAHISVFTSKLSKYYLNITMRNVVKVFRKDTVPESDGESSVDKEYVNKNLSHKHDSINEAVGTSNGAAIGNNIFAMPPCRVILRPSPEYPQYIKELYENTHFMENIRAYNQMFSMTSLGANVDKSINNGKGIYDAILCGDRDGSDLGLRTVLTASIPGGIAALLNGSRKNCTFSGFNSGKTFLWKAVTSTLRSEEKIVLTVAASCIATFQLADLLRQTDLIIWDEAPMNDRRCFEALDRSLRDISNSPNTLFGGKSIILGDEADSQNTFDVNIPDELCIPDSNATLANLINFIYDQKTLQTPTATDLQKKVIVCPKNESADMINAKVISMLNGQQQVYISLDEATPHGNDGGETELLYPPEYLNSLNFAGFPPHRLELKVGAPIILLRNLNISGGLCNGTRLIVTQLLNKVIEARIITGTRISEKVFLPRIPLINRDLQLPFIFKRKQFPVKLCYAMTINKSQGQSLERIAENGYYVHLSPMTEANDPAMAPVDKGKLPLIEANTVSIADIKPTEINQTIEVRVYRKWVAKNVKTHVASNFCAILLYTKGDAIQANMDLRDLDNFNRQLQLNNAYRISRFKCAPTKIWDRTLPNNTTLLFGTYTSIIPISNTNFPEHYFNFIAYNEVNMRADIPGAPLIDYIGCIYRISDPIRSGDATRARRTRRIIDIQNLDGINLPFLIWGDEAENFDMNQYEKMEKPVIIALSSAWATKRYGGILYCFKAIIDDGTATATITCFSPEAHTFVPECNTVVNSIEDKDNHHVPMALKQAEGQAYIFQYHFGQNARPGYPNFTLNAVLKPVAEPLLALPAAKTISSPPAEVLGESSIGYNPSTTNKESTPFAKDDAQELLQTPQETKTAKRGLFQETNTQGKKPRQDD
ncbi:DNA helicase [Tanacetum coccineum]|uniref:ATP-dependent DNA helicase n=1 Tax=Tanacetum coccineum TaxID=301880 RepID=A0ABQ5D150_9ASTR